MDGIALCDLAVVGVGGSIASVPSNWYRRTRKLRELRELKQSGNGREGGEVGLREFLEVKTISGWPS